VIEKIGGCTRTRTLDPLIKSQRLSSPELWTAEQLSLVDERTCCAHPARSPSMSGSVFAVYLPYATGLTEDRFRKMLIPLASPTGFEPVLPL
jgi:hypothetical protein